MESKIVKVIDEHSIDRVANIICSIDVDGSDYVIYWIERDSDNDNLFVSKLLKNIDGTSNMINIDDTMEKGKISSIVKELITYSVNNDSDKLSDRVVKLSDGKNVGISSVLINREQNINVQKTYITTVKKTVTKVSEDFYTVEVASKEQDDVISSNVSSIFEDITVSAPEVVAPIETSQDSSISLEPEVVSQVTPVMPIPSVVLPEPEVVSESNVDEPVINVEEPKISVLPVEPVNIEQSNIILPEVGAASEVSLDEKNIEEPLLVVPRVVTSEIDSTVSAVPVVPAESVESVKDVEVPTPVTSVSTENKMIFDGSKETNLNDALGEVVTESAITVNNVEPIREFGVDEQKTNTDSTEITKEIDSSVSSSSSNSGFANKKFFIVVAIVFFIISCVFLGYEVFRYFQLAK